MDDTKDTLDRLVAQAHAVTAALIGNDAHKSLNDEVVSNLLWLIQDRLNDIDKVVSAAKFVD